MTRDGHAPSFSTLDVTGGGRAGPDMVVWDVAVANIMANRLRRPGMRRFGVLFNADMKTFWASHDTVRGMNHERMRSAQKARIGRRRSEWLAVARWCAPEIPVGRRARPVRSSVQKSAPRSVGVDRPEAVPACWKRLPTGCPAGRAASRDWERQGRGSGNDPIPCPSQRSPSLGTTRMPCPDRHRRIQQAA